MQAPRLSKVPELSKRVHHQLGLYALTASAAGVAMMALVQPTEAKIIYRATHQKLPLNQDLLLDLNRDGINDFRFHITTFDANIQQTSGTQDSAFLWAYPQGTMNQVVGKTPYASALRAGARIGVKSPFAQDRGTMGGVIFTGFSPQYLGPWADSGKAVNHRYLGLKFLIQGKIHFGWARLNVRVYRNPESTIGAVLTGYAYETVPAKPIIAGKEHGGKELHESLGTLAAGSSANRISRNAGGNR